MCGGPFLRVGKVSMRANCENLFSDSCAVIRTRPRLSGYATKWGHRCEALPTRSIERAELHPPIQKVSLSWASDEVFLITPGSVLQSDATGLMRHPCLMATSFEPPVQTLL